MDINCFIDFTILKKDFCFKLKANIEFFLIVNEITMHNVVKQFQDHIIDVIKHLDYIYYYYSPFINSIQLK